jgi:hypothetical protein
MQEEQPQQQTLNTASTTTKHTEFEKIKVEKFKGKRMTELKKISDYNKIFTDFNMTEYREYYVERYINNMNKNKDENEDDE